MAIEEITAPRALTAGKMPLGSLWEEIPPKRQILCIAGGKGGSGLIEWPRVAAVVVRDPNPEQILKLEEVPADESVREKGAFVARKLGGWRSRWTKAALLHNYLGRRCGEALDTATLIAA
jgi:hypothetical protein